MASFSNYLIKTLKNPPRTQVYKIPHQSINNDQNANNYRGNQFGVNFDYNKIHNSKNYIIDNYPKIHESNLKVYTESPFYPITHHNSPGYPNENNYDKYPFYDWKYSVFPHVENFNNKNNNNYFSVNKILIITILLLLTLYGKKTILKLFF